MVERLESERQESEFLWEERLPVAWPTTYKLLLSTRRTAFLQADGCISRSRRASRRIYIMHFLNKNPRSCRF